MMNVTSYHNLWKGIVNQFVKPLKKSLAQDKISKASRSCYSTIKCSTFKFQKFGQIKIVRKCNYGSAYLPHLSEKYGGLCRNKYLMKNNSNERSRYFCTEKSPQKTKLLFGIARKLQTCETEAIEIKENSHKYVTRENSEKNVTKENSQRNVTRENSQKNVAQEIFDACCKVDRMFEIRGIAAVQKVVNDSLKCGLSVEQIKSLYKNSPKLILKCNITDVTKQLHEYGLQNHQIVSMYVENSKTVTLKAQTITNIFESLRNIGLSDKHLRNVVLNYPSILDNNPRDIVSRFTSLRALFSSKEMVKVIETVPVVLIGDIKEILVLYKYVNRVMGIKNEQIVKSFLFKHSIEHVRNRHLFLVRAGFFKQLKNTKGEVDPNPQLRDIIDVSDKKFVENFGNMTVMDYRTFCKLIDQETKEEGEFCDDDSDMDIPSYSNEEFDD